ncbi:hypothetical protein [Fundidesulfovibrio agrisoli]|uniref:hypothetical protein n=1 Tax=Fundidesulfovibrio agrisoli TaxID=2922717 RepID=UPI001FACFF06|nr:hypothetical protein [Fundidesulfovibrio agrisoli]
MIETRRVPVVNKVFQKKDIARLWEEFKVESSNFAQIAVRHKLAVSVVCADGSSFEMYGVDIEIDSDILDLKPVKRIEFSMYCYDVEKHMRFVVSSLAGDGELVVSSDDRGWVHSVIVRFNDVLGSISQQFTAVHRYGFLLIVILACCIGYLYGNPPNKRLF